jgi:hypothetical protein
MPAHEAKIEPGTRVTALDAFGHQLKRRAVSPVTMGHDFPVVWVAREDEWQAAQSEGRDPEAVPWPAEDVTPVEEDEEDENEAGFRIVQDAIEDD